MSELLPLLQKLARLKLSESEVSDVQASLSTITDWRRLLEQMELYAISNLVQKHVKEHEFKVPESLLLSLKGLAMRHRAAADARYTVMQELSAEFNRNKVPLVALKGLALAPMIYPEDELRPMRDIDILVPREQIEQAATLIRELGFDLPEAQPSKFMRDSHQLPNATKKINGFIVSVEVHHDALSRDVPGHIFYEDVQPFLQNIRWRDLELTTLGHEQMLHQVSRHLEGLHPGAVLKLINVLDVVLYSERYIDQIDWALVRKQYSHIINTLKCLHLIVPLSDKLQAIVGGTTEIEIANIGEIMLPLTSIINRRNTIAKQLQLLFKPSDWWLHLYYNVDPHRSLIVVTLLRHPTTIIIWLAKRLFSRILGG